MSQICGYKTLGSTNIKVYPIGFGGIPIQRVTEKEAIDVVKLAVSMHVNFFDSARGYTCSEEYLGKGLKGMREKVYIATKSMARTYEKMKEDINISLNNLQTDYIDVYQCHNVKESDLEVIVSDNGALKALLEAKEEGKIRHIGITSHSLEFIDKLLDSPYEKYFETIQIPCNFIEPEAIKVYEKAVLKNKGTIAMKPFGGGAIDNTPVAIKYLLNVESLSVLIPGMGSKDEVLQNLNVGKEKLTKEEIEYIDKTKKLMQGKFCHRCGYCLPCSVKIDIPSIFTLENYYDKYGLKDWALQRYAATVVKADACIHCGKCLARCPYNLDIPQRLARIVKKFNK